MPNCEIFSQISFCRSQQESDKVGRVGRLKAAFSNSVVTSKVDSQIGQGCSVPHHLREVFSIFRFRSSFFRFRNIARKKELQNEYLLENFGADTAEN